jgi:arabinogalactan oligomer/maltooligosaccharide transport system substrate-binding protein
MVELKNNSNVDLGDLDISRFINGEVSATFSGSWVRGDLEAAFGDRLGVAMMPSFTIDGSTYQMKAMFDSKCVGVNPYAGETEGKLQICTEFAAFLASEEAQLARYEMRGVIPAHKDLRYHPLITADQAAIAEMDTIAYASVLQPALEEMVNYWTPMNMFGNKLRNGDITFDNYEIAVDEMMDAFENPYW